MEFPTKCTVLATVVVLICLSFIQLSVGHESVGMTFELADNERACFYEEFAKVKRYVFVFQVLRGGLRDVDVSIESPNKKELYKETKVTKDSFEFESSWGKYTFCFSNEFSSFVHKTVYFELRPKDHKPLSVEAGIKKPFANTQIEESMEDLHKINTDIIRFQREYRLKESQGRFLAETINKGVFWWSAGQSVVIFFGCICQVLVLKCFFTEKRKSTAPTEGEEVKYVQPLNSA